jgi:hypothetical protein
MYRRDVLNCIRQGGICSFFLSILISIVPWTGFAQANVTLALSPSTDPIVAGLNIYYGGQSRVYTNEINAGTNNSLSISNLLNGSTYYFAATTYSAAGAESALSSEVSYTVLPPVNQAPTLNPLNNLAINENAGAQSVSLSGISAVPGNPNQTLTVTAISSNPSLIPNPSVAYTSPNASGSIAFASATNARGQATVSVSVHNGGASNNVVTQSFIVTVNPVDISKPKLSITAPTLNHHCRKAIFTVTGKARDNVAVATVYYSLNGAPWTNATTANSWTNWSATLSLVAGTNSLKAFAKDTSGNASTTNSVSFEYVVPVTTSAVSSSVEPIIASPAVLSTANFTLGQFALLVSGTTNAQYVVQASTDLVNWVSVQTNTAPFSYVDANAGQFSQRYYRAISVP